MESAPAASTHTHPPRPPAWYIKYKHSPSRPLANALVVEEKIQQWKQKGDPSQPLDLRDLNLTQFPHHLPADLVHLKISSNHFTHVPLLPRKLQIFESENGQIEVIEGPLPPTLHTLRLNYNHIHTLPLRFPQSLSVFRISGNNLVELPELWTPPPHSKHKGNLTYVDASSNKLHVFPIFPDSIQHIDLSSNRIPTFPTRLPSNLETLLVASNQIRHIPEHFPRMFPPSLKTITINHNALLDVQAGYWEMDFGGDYFVSSESEFAYIERIVVLQHKRREVTALQQAKPRTSMFKEELMMRVWRPERIEALLNAGYDPSDL